MINAEDYLALIKSLIALCPEVIDFTILREEVQVTKGLFEMRSPTINSENNISVIVI